jgi:hypothetical protein
VLAGAALAAAPLAPRLPWWVTVIGAAMVAWRAWAGWKNERLPRRWLLAVLVMVGMAAVYLNFRTIFGRDAGVTLLVLFLSLKLMETKERRDAVVVTFLCYFLALTNFFYSESMLTAAIMLVTVLALTAGLVGVNGPQRPLRESARLAGVLLAQGVPVMVLLFFLFPRVQGPMWGIPTDALAGTTGLSDSMTPGNISLLSQSDAVAFRAQFPDGAPERKRLYWRGPVFWHFDGRTWRPGEVRLSEFAKFDPLSAPILYTVTLEPHERALLFALEMAGRVPRGAGATGDFQLLSRRPVTARIRYEMSSFLQYRAMGGSTPGELAAARELPRLQSARDRARAGLAARARFGRAHPRACGRLVQARRARVHARPAAARARLGRPIPVRDQERVLRALLVGVRGDDARRRRAGAHRDRVPGRRDQPDRRLHDRAPVRRPRLGRGLDRRRGLGAGRPDGGGGTDARRVRPRRGGAGRGPAAVPRAGGPVVAAGAPVQLGGARELL